MDRLILIIDDSELVLEMVQSVCDDAGFKTTTAASVAEARQALAADHVDAVVADLNLPDLGDDSIVEVLREATDHPLPVVLVSGMSPAELQRKADELGADGAISKETGFPAIAEQLPVLLERLTTR